MNNTVSTKQSLIDNSIHFLKESGYQNLTFAKIAKLSGVSQPAVYRHFKNKVDLLSQCCLYSAEQGRNFIDERTNRTKSPKHQFTEYIYANLSWAESESSLAYSLLAMYYFAPIDPAISNINRIVKEKGVERISEYIHQGNHSKHWKISNIKDLSEVIQSMLMGSMIKIIHQTTNLETEKKIIIKFVNQLLSKA